MYVIGFRKLMDFLHLGKTVMYICLAISFIVRPMKDVFVDSFHVFAFPCLYFGSLWVRVNYLPILSRVASRPKLKPTKAQHSANHDHIMGCTSCCDVSLSRASIHQANGHLIARSCEVSKLCDSV